VRSSPLAGEAGTPGTACSSQHAVIDQAFTYAEDRDLQSAHRSLARGDALCRGPIRWELNMKGFIAP